MLISLESIYRSYVAVALILSGWLKTAKLEGESPPVIGTDLPWWGRVGAGQLVDLGKICPVSYTHLTLPTIYSV